MLCPREVVESFSLQVFKKRLDVVPWFSLDIGAWGGLSDFGGVLEPSDSVIPWKTKK